jgi:hypothetical protein
MRVRCLVGLVVAACAADPAPVARVVVDPPRPLGPSLIATGTAAALFTWAPPVDRIDRYQLELDAGCAGLRVAACPFTSAVRVTVDEPRWRDDRGRRGRHLWRVRACTGDGDGGCSPWSRARWADLGRAAADIDGDGRSDVAAGAPLVDLGGHDRGAVLVVFARGSSARIDEPAGSDGAELGVALAVADLDADGAADLVAGAPGTDGGAGRVYVYRGPDLGTGERAGADAPARPTFALDAPGGKPGDWLGAALIAADFDGDGHLDVAVAAPGTDGARPGETDVGRVLVWRGGPTGLDPAPARVLSPPDPSPYDGFGATLTAGDLDGDGYADLAVGAAGIDRAGKSRGTDRGAVYLYRGSADGLYGAPIARLEAPVPLDHDRFGYALSAGDLDGDQRADLAVGAPSSESADTDTGAVYLFTGAAALAGTAPHAVLTVDAIGAPADHRYRRFGSAVAAVGDVDRDGVGDLAVGTSGPDRGLALLYRGSREAIARAPWAVLRDPGTAPHSDFGDSVGAAGDLDGDGHADLVIGAASDRRGGRQGGSILLYRGTRTGVSPPRVIDGPTEQAHFGRSLAGR